MKVLNLDKFAGVEKRQLVIAGKTFEVPPMNVDNFIKTTKAAEGLREVEDLSVQIEATIEMILRSVPGMAYDDLGGLELAQLQAIVAFIKGDDVQAPEEVEQESDGQPGK